MYTEKNFQTKKALKEVVANGERVTVFQPNNIFNVEVPSDGSVAVEGPHYPQPHKWYANVVLKNGRVVKVK